MFKIGMLKYGWLLVLALLATGSVLPASAQIEPAPMVIGPEVLQAAVAAEAANGRDVHVRSAGVRADFTLTSNLDTIDATPGDGACADAGALCTLRAAVMEANALGGTHTITIPAGYNILLTLGVVNNDNADSGDLDIYADITITGQAGIQPRIRNTIGDRVFHVINASAKLSLSNLMLQMSGGPTISGGAVFVVDGGFSADLLSVYSNTGYVGGGITITGSPAFSINRSTVAYNTSYANGGGLNLQFGATGTIVNSSIFANFAPLINTTNYPGAGLFVYGPANVQVIHTTITQNYSAYYGGGFSAINTTASPAPVTFSNSIISGNSTGYAAPDCYLFLSANPTVAFTDMNFIGEISPNCPVGGDPAVTVIDVGFGPLTNTTHPMVIPLTAGSVAINAAPTCPAILGGIDQMNNPRPAGSACDLGAYELPAGKSGTLDVSPTSGEPLSSFTITVNDLDLVALSTIEVQAITRNTLYPDSETITLTETAPGSGEFTALVLLGAVPATPNNGTIEAGLGHEVAVSYYDTVTADADDATLEAAYTVAALPAANLLTNGDFELGPSSWTIVATNGDKVKSQNPFDGLKAFKFKGGAGKLPASLSQTVLNPAVANGNTLYAQAMISSGPAASGKMLLNIKTSSGRQVKASVVYAKNGAYALHFIQVPLVLDSGETVIKALLRFTDASQSGKVHVDAVSLSVQVPNDPRASSRSGVMLPPPQPDGFRGQN